MLSDSPDAVRGTSDGLIFVIDLDGMRWHASSVGWQRAWRRDRARFLANWPETSVLYRWLDEHLA